jgi:hypothetical protein
MYATETRFYREVLAISFEFGSHLRKLGLLTPDAQLDTGGVLFLLTPEKIREALAKFSWPRPRGSKTSPPNPYPHEKIASVSLVSRTPF